MTGVHSSRSPNDSPVGRERFVPNGCGPDNDPTTWYFSEFSTIHRAYYYYYR
jgi:hypothetical protein